MERRTLWFLAIGLGVAIVVFAVCSNDDRDSPTTAPTSVPATTTSAPATSVTSTAPSTSTAPPTTGTAPSTATTGATTSTAATSTTTTTPATTEAPGPLEVEAGGWRLAVERPLAGAAIGPTTLVCYAVTGETREAIVALELILAESDTSTAVAENVVDIGVGRGGAAADFTAAAPGRYDLVITLVLNGERRDDLSIRVAGVQLDPDVPSGTCG